MLKNKWFQFSLALFVVPFVLNLVFYNQLPDVVPTHFDVNGQVDGTMPKFMGLFGMLFLCLAIHVFTYDLSSCLYCDKYDNYLFWLGVFF